MPQDFWYYRRLKAWREVSGETFTEAEQRDVVTFERFLEFSQIEKGFKDGNVQQ